MVSGGQALSSGDYLARSSAPLWLAPRHILFDVGERRGERLEGLWTCRYLGGPDPIWCRGERCGEEDCKRAEQNVIDV
jgi:hypothetical protein